jgi:PhoPQ-activated pathogenicity-related protein
MKPLIFFRLTAVLFITVVSCTRRDTTSYDPSVKLEEYVMSEDNAYRYEIVELNETDFWKEYRIRMVSGTWMKAGDVEPVEWWHWVNVIIPFNVLEDEGMMIIGGGSATDSLPPESEEWLIQVALATGSIISRVSNIPFQPLDFQGDEKVGRYEDDLIAYGWRKFLEGGAKEEDVEWLARLPMTRAVSRAMDVVQDISVNEFKPVFHFFITGASKRGWTTWTTAAVDERVIGIAPVVIDLLNIIPSFQHHWRCYGEWSPAVSDYTDQGIMDWMDTPEFKTLLEIVEPYSFIDRITMPKMIINAASDEFFVTDSWQYYWNDLQGPKYLQYIPNSGHGLEPNYQPLSMISFYNAIIKGLPIPQFEWDIRSDTIFIRVDPDSDYRLVKWQAVNPDGRDFRLNVIGKSWQEEEISTEEDGTYSILVDSPETGYRAGLVAVTFNPRSNFPMTFTTGTLVTPDTYPFPPFEKVKE